jgi:DNA-binding beta-propeller fold protein YncE
MTVTDETIGLLGVGYIVVDPAGAVYVTDVDRGHVIKLSPDGRVLARWGGPGDGPGQFDGPCGLAVDVTGSVYVSDEPNGRVHKISINGEGIASWGRNGTAPDELRHPQGLALDGQGNLLIADTHNSRIQIRSPSGRVLRVIGESRGSDPGQFDHPADVAVDSQGTIFIADTRNARIQRLSPTGHVLGIWQRGGSRALECPVGVAVDEQENLFVADSGATPRLVKILPWGIWSDVWCMPEPIRGGYVQGVAVGASGNVFVTAYDALNNPGVVVFSAGGEVMQVWH